MFSFIPRIAAEGLLCARLCVRLMVTIIARIAEGCTTHKSLCCRIPYVPTTTLRDACHCPHIQVRTLRPKRERQLAQGYSTVGGSFAEACHVSHCGLSSWKQRTVQLF